MEEVQVDAVPRFLLYKPGNNGEFLEYQKSYSIRDLQVWLERKSDVVKKNIDEGV